MVPPLAGGDELEPTRRRFAERVRKEMETRKRALNILTYDESSSGCATRSVDQSAAPGAGPPA